MQGLAGHTRGPFCSREPQKTCPRSASGPFCSRTVLRERVLVELLEVLHQADGHADETNGILRCAQRTSREQDRLGIRRVGDGRRPVVTGPGGNCFRIPAAGGRQKDATGRFHGRPIGSGPGVGSKSCISRVDTRRGGNAVGVRIAIREDDQAFRAVYRCLAVTGSGARVQQIAPLVGAQRAPNRADGGAPVHETAGIEADIV